MSYLKPISLTLLFAFLASCFGTTPTPAPPASDPAEQVKVDRDDDDYERRKRDDEDRDEVLERTRTRYSGNVCEDEDRDHDCKDICRDIYTSRSDREDCEELPIAQVERLEELHDLLEDPDDDDLADVEFDDFDVYLNINIKPLDKLIGKYSRSEAREFMFWLLENDDVARVFKKEDDEHGTLKTLLEKIDSNGDTDDNIYKWFVAKLDGSDRLMEVAIANGDDDTMEWLMDFINEMRDDGSDDCADDETSVKCFTVYCKIGAALDDDSQDDWLSFTEFEDYIEDIIDTGTNAVLANTARSGGKWCKAGRTRHSGNTCTDNNEIEDVGDVDNWVDDLCGGL